MWQICRTQVDHLPSNVMKARGTCPAAVFLELGLAIDPNGIPHPRHADVVAWPTRKNEQKLLQQKIAAAMALEVRPPDE